MAVNSIIQAMGESNFNLVKHTIFLQILIKVPISSTAQREMM